MATAASPPSRRLLWNDPAARGWVYQGLLILAVGFVFVEAVLNGRDNMAAHGIPTDFRFWTASSGFDITQSLIPYSPSSSYGRACLVGLLNTLLVAALGIVFATIIGFTVGIGRLSSNWVVAKLATAYVETVRNVPLLLQLLFWYNAVLAALPGPRQSIVLPGSIYLNARGLFVPQPIFGPDAVWVGVALLLGLAAAIGWRFYAHARKMRTGTPSPVISVALGLVIGLPLLVFFATGRPVGFDLPQLRGFNFIGGGRLIPEFVTLLLGLSIYTGAFIGEIVRAGIRAVSYGQGEAAEALGLNRAQVLRFVVVPQALRVIIPPLTSQYLNLTKNSSLAVFIGYPDLVQVFAGTVLNQTGAAVQVIGITMGIYLTISLVTSTAMNAYNRRVALVER
jgi:general L-amino acid transport system permease protein